ncbi:hypothetical protein B7R54_02255 [Subtercola boreus]|uniref:Flagellar biosynthesis protein n=1 Tax=Subtercola boreus TaxID=120213 RepID=A0A3E0VFM2_9MICO|nr:hypothetical protein [Subtercola boreus]RFA08170.1 hypothetical protein B7R54_02255 [Subtercola boreus]TQL54939.1 hypothetical protein FB464_2489 [Subtercola boreus]
MTLSALRSDALAATPNGFELRLGLPWIRSMPLSSVGELALTLDDTPVAVDITVGDRCVAPDHLADEPGWWFIQDRLVLAGHEHPLPGEHDVEVRFTLMVPYLQGGPGAPLALPFRIAGTLTPDAAAGVPTVSRDVA